MRVGRQLDGGSRGSRVALAGVGLTIALSLVAMAARSPLSGSAQVNAEPAQTPVAALGLVLAGTGIFALAALVILAPFRRRSLLVPDEPPPPQVHWLWKVLAVGLLILVSAGLIAAAMSGVRNVGRTPHVLGGVPPGLSLPRRPGGGSGGFVLAGWLPWAALALVLTAVLVGLAWLILRRSEPSAGGRAKRSAATAAVDAAIGALEIPGDPRSAVIAAYAAMEQTLAAHGVARSRTEAPREYVRRALASTEPAGDEARTLTGLFEQARYSPTPVPDRARELALATLSSLRERLQRGGEG